jgi:hypothetical protein
MDKTTKSMEQRAWSKEFWGKSKEKRAKNEEPVKKNAHFSVASSEKGLALVTVLVLSLICLTIISTLLYMVIQGTKFSGFYKRYETAREAALGGAALGSDLIMQRGELIVPGLINMASTCDCGDPDDPNDNEYGGVPSCICDKLCDTAIVYPGPVLNWVNCGPVDISLDPATNPDIQFTLTGLNTTYLVSAKIVDVVRGNTNLSGEALGGTGVVASTSTTIQSVLVPYMYRVEILAEDVTGDTLERARFSALYAF